MVCGRICGCYGLHNYNFGTLPPRYGPDDIQAIMNDGGFRDVVPGYDRYPPGFKVNERFNVNIV